MPVVTTLATPLVGPPIGEVEGVLAVTDETLSTTFSLATIEPFTAPAITPAMIKRMKIDRQIVHLSSALVLSFPGADPDENLTPLGPLLLLVTERGQGQEESGRVRVRNGIQRLEDDA